MSEKNNPAFPIKDEAAGLTKREYFAAMALQGLLSNPDYNCPSDPHKLPTTTTFAKAALHYADALLSQLEKPQP